MAKPIRSMENDLADFVALQKTKEDSENSWTVNIKDLDQGTLDLSVKNPHAPEDAPLREPKDILNEMKELDKESADLLDIIMEML